LYFADHEPDLAALVREGRHSNMRLFGRMAGHDAVHLLADPCDRTTFERSKLDFSERERHPEAYHLHRDLLRLRREDAVFSAQRADRIHGAVLATEAFLLRYFGPDDEDRLLLVNLGRDLLLRPATDPLLVPPAGSDWRLLWSSENPRYGGSGTSPLDTRNWHVAGHAAYVLSSVNR
jgi:maltooligosyltrehalose trehalohydrolase